MSEQKTFPTLKYRSMEPPGGWVFKDLDTNFWTQSHQSLDDLVQQCANHRRLNKLTTRDDFAQFIEASICYRVDPSLVIGLPENHNPSKEMLTLFKVNKYTTNFLQNWQRSGAQIVSQEEATNRAAVCVNCDLNAKHICLTCKGIDEWIYGWNHRKTSHDKQLGICNCDAIILFASVHAVNPEVKLKGYPVLYPDHCWKKEKELPNV